MKKIRTLIIWILPIITLLLGWQLGVQSMQRTQDSTTVTSINTTIVNPEKDVKLDVFWQAWRLLLAEYIDPNSLNANAMVNGAIAGMVRAVNDPYTSYMNPEENNDFRHTLEGSLQGIGAELTLRDNALVVVAPLKGSPAMKAGLQTEDIIVKIDDKPTEGVNLQDLIKSIRGKAGTSVTLSIARKGSAELLSISIIREEITVPSTEYSIKELDGKKVGYIALNQFGDHTTEDMQAAMDSFKNTKLAGIIVDVRFNGGGYLDKSIDIVSMFIKEGKVVSIDRRGKELETEMVHGNPIDVTTPMVVLINQGSASASEILAGALQDYKRATIMGETSFGKGTVQELYPLPGGGSMRITVAKWLTPNGKNLSKAGVHPDYTVVRSIEEIKQQIDPQLDAALEFLVHNTKPAAISSSSSNVSGTSSVSSK